MSATAQYFSTITREGYHKGILRKIYDVCKCIHSWWIIFNFTLTLSELFAALLLLLLPAYEESKPKLSRSSKTTPHPRKGTQRVVRIIGADTVTINSIILHCLRQRPRCLFIHYLRNFDQLQLCASSQRPASFLHSCSWFVGWVVR